MFGDGASSELNYEAKKRKGHRDVGVKDVVMFELGAKPNLNFDGRSARKDVQMFGY